MPTLFFFGACSWLSTEEWLCVHKCTFVINLCNSYIFCIENLYKYLNFFGKRMKPTAEAHTEVATSEAFSTTCAVHIEDCEGCGGCPVVIAQWQSTGGSS